MSWDMAAGFDPAAATWKVSVRARPRQRYRNELLGRFGRRLVGCLVRRRNRARCGRGPQWPRIADGPLPRCRRRTACRGRTVPALCRLARPQRSCRGRMPSGSPAVPLPSRAPAAPRACAASGERCRYPCGRSPTRDRCRRRRAAPAARLRESRSSGTPGMWKSIALPFMCWLNLATPLDRRRSWAFVGGRAVTANHPDRLLRAGPRDEPPTADRSHADPS